MVREAELRHSIRSPFSDGDLWNIQTGVIMEQDRTSSFAQCLLLPTQFSAHSVDFLTIGLCCDGLPRLQKVIVNHTNR